MDRSDFSYALPKRLIAQCPLSDRTSSRLLYLSGDDGSIDDLRFVDLYSLINAGDLLVFNDTKVIPARLFGRKQTGGKVEILVERVLSEKKMLAQIKTSKPPKVGTAIYIGNDHRCLVVERQDNLYILEFMGEPHVLTILQSIGRTPLPPYITRVDDKVDRTRYQTVYAKTPGAVAAPTAGLHFDSNTMTKMRKRGINIAFLTLHVGSGTFTPIRTKNIDDHRLHPEVYDVPENVVDQIHYTRQQGGRVIAVGTTVVRALESASIKGKQKPFRGETNLFIKPGYRFQYVDAMVTNFHLPESSLLVLVCAFAGRNHIINAYKHAVKKEYRFFSYGDAMFITLSKTRHKSP